MTDASVAFLSPDEKTDFVDDRRGQSERTAVTPYDLLSPVREACTLRYTRGQFTVYGCTLKHKMEVGYVVVSYLYTSKYVLYC